MKKKEDLYKFIKVAGLVSFIPLLLVSGPFGGYLIGNYLKNRFGLGDFIDYLFIFLGFITSLFEIIRIVRLLIRIEKH